MDRDIALQMVSTLTTINGIVGKIATGSGSSSSSRGINSDINNRSIECIPDPEPEPEPEPETRTTTRKK